MASNQIKGQEAIKTLAKSYEELAQRIDAAAKETNDFVAATQKLPSEYVKSIEKLRSSSDNYAKSLAETIEKQDLYNASQRESERIANETIKIHGKLNKVMSEENKQLNVLRNTLKIKNKIAREDAEITDKLTSEYRRQSIILNRLKLEYKDVAMREGEASNQARRLLSDITKLDARLKSVDANVGEFKRSIGNYGKAMRSATAAARQLAAGLGLVGGAFLVANTIKDAFNTLREFDKQMIAVGKTTGISGPELEKFRKEIARLGVETSGVSIQGLAKSAEVAGQLGIQGSENILKFSETIEKLKLTSDIVGEDSVRQFAKFIEVSRDSVENADRLGSVITQLGNNFATTERQILKNATEIQKGISIYNVSAESALALGAATSALGSEAEQSRSAMQKAFKVLNDGAVSGKNLEKILKLTGTTAEEFREQFSQDAVKTFQDFIKGMSDASERGEDLSTILKELGLDAIRTEVVVGILATNYDVLSEAVSQANQEYVDNKALTEEHTEATKSLDVAIKDLSDAWDGLVLSIENGDGPISDFFKKITNFLEGAINGMTLFNEKFNDTLDRVSSGQKEFSKESELGFLSSLSPEEAESAAIRMLDITDAELETEEDKLKVLKAQRAELLGDGEQLRGKALRQQRDGLRELEPLIEASSRRVASLTGKLEAYDQWLGITGESVADLSKAEKEAEAEEDYDGDNDKIALLEGTVAWYQAAIKELKELRDNTAQTTPEYASLTAQIDGLNAAISELTTREGTVEWYQAQIKALKTQRDSVSETSEEYAKFTQEIDNLTSAMKELQGIDLSSEYDDGASAAERLNDKLIEGFKKFKDKEVEEEERAAEERKRIAERLAADKLALEQQLTDQSIDLINSLVQAAFEADLNRLENQLEADNERYEAAYEAAEGNSAAQEEIRRQQTENEEKIQEKRQEIERKAFLFEQGVAFAKNAIETFRAVAAIKAQAAILAANPITAALAPTALAQIPLVIASGALAGASILAQAIPQFKDGVIDFGGGPAILGDGGVSEVAVLPSGQAFRTPDTDTLYNLPKGTNVYKNEKAFQDALMNELSFNGILPSKGIVGSIKKDNNALTKDQFNNGIKSLQRTIKSGEHNQLIFDEKGIQKWRVKNGKKTEIRNSRITGRGRKI